MYPRPNVEKRIFINKPLSKNIGQTYLPNDIKSSLASPNQNHLSMPQTRSRITSLQSLSKVLIQIVHNHQFVDDQQTENCQ